MANGVIDLEQVIKPWAEKMFNATKTREQSSIPKDCIDFQVEWQDVKTVHGQPKFESILPNVLPKSQVLFKTCFTNNTRSVQTYSFKTERVTRSTCDVTIEKGVTMGFDVGVKLKVPFQVVEANAGFKREVTLTKAEGETVEEELTWSADSNVTVPPEHITTAELRIQENQLSKSFTIESKAWGRIHVTVFDKRNNSFMKSIDGFLPEIFWSTRVNGLSVDADRGCVNFQTKGKCTFRYAVQQHVELFEEELQAYESD